MKYSLSTAARLLVAFALAASLPAAAHAKNPDANTAPVPQITNGPVAEYVADTQARIGWSTEEKTHMGVRYGTDPAHLDQVAQAVEKEHGRNHHASIKSLKPDTQYFFQVVTAANESASDVGTFRTQPAKAPPIEESVIVP